MFTYAELMDWIKDNKDLAQKAYLSVPMVFPENDAATVIAHLESNGVAFATVAAHMLLAQVKQSQLELLATLPIAVLFERIPVLIPS